MLTCRDIPMRPNSLHQAKRITFICVICINFHIELTAASFFFKCIFIIRFFHKNRLILIHCWELAINLQLVSYVRGRNRKPLPWRRHGICSFFMFITWTALFTDLTFGKDESQGENHFLSLDSLMSTTLLIYILSSLLLKRKEVMSQQLAKAKSKTNV